MKSGPQISRIFPRSLRPFDFSQELESRLFTQPSKRCFLSPSRMDGGQERRFFAQTGNAATSAFVIGLTLPIQRVINARFALGSRE
jgi:hypothetical protein